MKDVRNLKLLTIEELRQYAAELEKTEVALRQSNDQLETQARVRIVEMEGLKQALA